MFFSDDFQRKEQFYRLPLFRKLRYNAFINTMKSEDQFIQKFQDTFGDPGKTTVIIGDWDSSHYTPRGQVTTKGKGFR